MKEERMFILKMVSEGKITADEAVGLINALSASGENKRSFDSIAHSVKYRAASFAEKAEPKVKKAAMAFKEKSSEFIDNIKGKFSKADDDSAAAQEEFEYVDLTLDDGEDMSEETARDSEMERNDDTLPVSKDDK